MDSTQHSSEKSSPKSETMSPPNPKQKQYIPNSLSQFPWVEIKANESVVEVNYLETFFKNSTGVTIDYRRLDIPKADPNAGDQNMSFDIASIHTRLSKWGGLSMGDQKEKNKELNYDLEDSFIDDAEGAVSNFHNPGYIESTFEDFVCLNVNINMFKNSNYYKDRVQTIKKSLLNEATEKEKKKKRVSPKDKEKKREKSETGDKEKKKEKKREKSEGGDKENKEKKEKKDKKEEKKREKSEAGDNETKEKKEKKKEKSETEDKENKENKENKEHKEPKEKKEKKEKKDKKEEKKREKSEAGDNEKKEEKGETEEKEKKKLKRKRSSVMGDESENPKEFKAVKLNKEAANSNITKETKSVHIEL